MSASTDLSSVVRRGDVFYANLDPVVGDEIGKRRPVLIIQNDIGNRYSTTVIAAAITGYSAKKASYPVCVAVEADEGGLRKRSVVNCSQIRTLDRKRLGDDAIGHVSDETMESVEEALRNSLGM